MWSIVLISQSPSAEVAKKLPGTEETFRCSCVRAQPTTGFFFYSARSKVIEIE